MKYVMLLSLMLLAACGKPLTLIDREFNLWYVSQDDNPKYFGPLLSASSCDLMLRVLYKTQSPTLDLSQIENAEALEVVKEGIVYLGQHSYTCTLERNVYIKG